MAGVAGGVTGRVPSGVFRGAAGRTICSSGVEARESIKVAPEVLINSGDGDARSGEDGLDELLEVVALVDS